MKNSIFGLLLLLSTSSFAAGNILTNYTQKIENIRKMLRTDDTDAQIYELRRFSCHNFSKRLFIQNSSLIRPISNYNISDMQRDWEVSIYRNNYTPKFKLYYVTLSTPSHGYFHAINAILLDESRPSDLNSYVYIEPQTDVLYSKDQLMDFSERMMRKTFTKPVEVSIQIFDEFKFNGNIWQSFSTEVQAGQVSH